MRLRGTDLPYVTDLRAAGINERHPLAGATLVLLGGFIICAYLWADHAVLDEVTLGQGKVVPLSREQVIQSLEGGIIAEMMVKEGDAVKAGQVLVRLDDTRFATSYREGKSRNQSVRAAIARLQAESTGAALAFPGELTRTHPELVQAETALYQSRRRALDEGVIAVRRSLALAEQELAMTAPLVDKGAVSEVDVLRLKRQINELRGSIQERQDKFRADARSELNRNQAELDASSEITAQRADQFKRTVIKSPMAGTVKNIRVSTVGGVVQPGMDIMEIVPAQEQLLVEARIRPSDVAFLRPGLPAMVKIGAYDFSVYGGLEGTLEHISADTIAESSKPDDAFYRIRVRTKHGSLNGKDGPLPIIPGMTATVEILTGKKTVLSYILKPIFKARQTALRER